MFSQLWNWSSSTSCSFLAPWTRALFFAICIATFLPAAAFAALPQVDARGVAGPGGPFDIPTYSIFPKLEPGAPTVQEWCEATDWCDPDDLPGGIDGWSVPDEVGVMNPGTATHSFLGFLYGTAAVEPFHIVLTTFYGLDLDPNLDDDDALMTGFDALNPELSFFNERFLGLTQEHTADPLGLFAIGALDGNPLFDDFDFSRFSGDPDSVVYAFRATVPLSEFAMIPEPSSILLAGIGLLGLGAHRRRRASAAN